MCVLMINIASILMAVWSELRGLPLELAWGGLGAGPLRVGNRAFVLQQALWGGGGDTRCHKKPDFGALSSQFPSQSTRETEGGKAGLMEPTIICTLSLTYSLSACGQAGCSFESGVRFAENRLGCDRVLGTFCSPQINSNILLPVSCNCFGQFVNNTMTYSCSFLKQCL